MQEPVELDLALSPMDALDKGPSRIPARFWFLAVVGSILLHGLIVFYPMFQWYELFSEDAPAGQAEIVLVPAELLSNPPTAADSPKPDTVSSAQQTTVADSSAASQPSSSQEVPAEPPIQSAEVPPSLPPPEILQPISPSSQQSPDSGVPARPSQMAESVAPVAVEPAAPIAAQAIEPVSPMQSAEALPPAESERLPSSTPETVVIPQATAEAPISVAPAEAAPSVVVEDVVPQSAVPATPAPIEAEAPPPVEVVIAAPTVPIEAVPSAPAQQIAPVEAPIENSGNSSADVPSTPMVDSQIAAMPERPAPAVSEQIAPVAAPVVAPVDNSAENAPEKIETTVPAIAENPTAIAETATPSPVQNTAELPDIVRPTTPESVAPAIATAPTEIVAPLPDAASEEVAKITEAPAPPPVTDADMPPVAAAPTPPVEKPTRSEMEVASLPSNPPPSPVPPSTPQPAVGGKPLDAPTDVNAAFRDRITSYVASYDAGACTLLSVASATPARTQVTGFGSKVEPFVAFDAAFTAKNGFEATTELTMVTTAQCRIIDALGAMKEDNQTERVHLDRTVIKSGSNISGRLEEQAQGGAAGKPELYIVDDSGKIHDARGLLRPASNSRPGWQFSFPLTLTSQGKEAPALVLSIWARSGNPAPKPFAANPGSDIRQILDGARSYSLVSFKVER